jgi:hypothetical protein
LLRYVDGLAGKHVELARELIITLLGGAAVAWPLAARAQARRPLVGYLAGAASASVMRGTTAPAFINGLREQGYVEGRDISPEAMREHDAWFSHSSLPWSFFNTVRVKTHPAAHVKSRETRLGSAVF